MRTSWVERHPFITIVGLLGVLLGTFFVAFTAASQGVAPSLPKRLAPSEYDEHLLALDKEGIEAAYREQVKLLFKNWMNDPNIHQPARALTGLRNAAKAYIQAMDGAKQRQEEIKARDGR